ncbi:hypothetical protein QUF61_12690 [Candidatus Venteria ishoeyi]|uniref:hypothetical protein n=1 Tax=Candidatus Venteria ishoeyi TaxID=1899563 RepID=UPI0025A5CF5E|nr:hypothetical protein [Candidatus Venteria ishoeyi]MDM8547347.1 hypothetical protein [Candidatus Venteria ishoeyi]
MAKKTIPTDIKNEVQRIVDTFNQNIIKNPENFYNVRYRGGYLYLGRSYSGASDPVCRLKYQGEIDNWDFAIYKYSTEKYDPDDWLFPGTEYLNGTVEGAMKAGLKAYPPIGMEHLNGTVEGAMKAGLKAYPPIAEKEKTGLIKSFIRLFRRRY